MKYETIKDATRAWVSEFNRFPQDMIGTLMGAAPDDWQEVTPPASGDRVFVYADIEEESTSSEGEIQDYNEETDTYTIEMDDGVTVELSASDFDVDRMDLLPMWGAMWQFGDELDNEWINDHGGLRALADCGFRVYFHEEWGYFFGIDGAGYDFYEAHWIPLYKKRGLEWHKTE